MILDKETHREILIGLINVLQFSGKREDIKKAMEEVDEVLEAVKKATVNN